MQFKALLIDVDGTAVDTEHINRSAITQVAAKAGFEVLPHHWDVIAGCDTKDIWEFLSGQRAEFPDGNNSFTFTFPNSKSFVDAYAKALEESDGQITANEPVKQIVQEFLDNALDVAAVSNSEHHVITRALKQTGYPTQRFSALVGKDTVLKEGMALKPSADPYHLGIGFINERRSAGMIEIHPRECLILEDTRTGAEAGLRTGATVLQITDSTAPLKAKDVVALSRSFKGRYISTRKSQLFSLFQMVACPEKHFTALDTDHVTPQSKPFPSP